MTGFAEVSSKKWPPGLETCAADNGGSYVDCGTLAILAAYGSNKSPDVNYTNVQATATRWVSTTNNVNGGSGYKYDTADGKIVPIP